MKQGTRSQCSGTIRGKGWAGRRDGVQDGEGKCIPVVDTCWCMQKPSQYCSNYPPIKSNWFLKVPGIVILNISESGCMIVVHSPTCVPVFATPMDFSTPSPLSLTISQSLPKFLFTALVMPSSHLILWCPLLLLSFPQSGTFPMSHLFTSDDQNTGASASASVLPGNIQVWSPLSLTSLTSLLSEGLSGVFSSTSVWRYQFFGVLPSLWPSSYNHLWPQVIYLLFWFCFISISCYKQVWFTLFLGSLSAFSLAARRSPFFLSLEITLFKSEGCGDVLIPLYSVFGCLLALNFWKWKS